MLGVMSYLILFVQEMPSFAYDVILIRSLRFSSEISQDTIQLKFGLSLSCMTGKAERLCSGFDYASVLSRGLV